MKKAAIVILAVIGIIVLVTQTNVGHVLHSRDIHQIAHYIRSFGFLSIFISGLLIALQTFVPFIPFFILAGVNVIVFGPIWGFIITWISAVIGASLNFFVARYLAYDWAQSKVGNLPFFQRLNEQAEKSGFRLILMARLVPILPSSAVNAAAGVSKVSFSQFLIATLIGKFPMTLLEAILGHDIFDFHRNKWRLLFVVCLLGLLMWGGSKLGKAYERKAEAAKASLVGRDNPDAVEEGSNE